MPQAGLSGAAARPEVAPLAQEPKTAAGSSDCWRQAKTEGQTVNGAARVARGSFSRRSTTAEIHPQKTEKTELTPAPTAVSAFTATKSDAKSDVQAVPPEERSEARSESDTSSESLSGFGVDEEDEAGEQSDRAELAIKPQDAEESQPQPPMISVIVPEAPPEGTPQGRQSWVYNVMPRKFRSSIESLPRISWSGSSAQNSRNSSGSRGSGATDRSSCNTSTSARRWSTKSDLMQSEHSQIWHEVHQTIYDCITSEGSYTTRFGRLRRMFHRRWRDFRFFGVNRNDRTPRVWGQRILAEKNASTRELLTNMVANHHHQQEMRLQLRDDSVRLQYLDAFRTDCEPEDWLVRVFSPGASLMEYIKLMICVWTFLFSLTIVAFWKVMRPLEKELLIVDGMVDFVYAFLLVMQLRTTILKIYVGKEVCGKRKIFQHHIKDWRFWADVVSCVPLFLLYEFTGSGRDAPVWVMLVKALRGWRIGRLPPKHRFIPSMSFLIFRVSLGMLMFGHFLACIWFTLVHEMDNTLHHHIKSEDERWQECASAVDPPAGCLFRLYSVSINQGIYLLMGIDRDAYSAWEHFFLTICMPLGALVHAYVFGEMILLVQRRGALQTRQNEHTLAIQEAMRILGLSPSLQVRIITYFTFERLNRCGGLFHELFTDLSPQLRFELQLQLYLDLVVQSGLFKNMRPRVIREIVVHLKDLIFLPGDWICRFGDYGDSMYFIVTGSCKILAKDTVTVMRELGHGCYFGEVALLTGVPRTAYVLASTFCIVAHLTKEVFEPIVKKWPEEIDNLLQGVEQDSDRKKIREEAARHYDLPIAQGRRVSNTGRRESNTGQAFSRRLSGNLNGRSSARVSTGNIMDDGNRVEGVRKSLTSENSRRRVSAPEAMCDVSRLASACIAPDVAAPTQQIEEERTPIRSSGKRLSRGNTCPVSVEKDPAANESMLPMRRPSPMLMPSLVPPGMVGIGMPTGALTRQVMQTAMEQSMQAEALRHSFAAGEASSPAYRSVTPLGGMPSGHHRSASFSSFLSPAEDRRSQEDLERHRSEYQALVRERDAEVECLGSELTDLLEAVAKLDDDVREQRNFLTSSLTDLKKTVFETCQEAVSTEVAKLGSMGMNERESLSGSSSGMLEAMVI